MNFRPRERVPDFKQLLKVLNREAPNRPTLFELFVCDQVIERVTGISLYGADKYQKDLATIKAYEKLGYDYALIMPSAFEFKAGMRNAKSSYSLNDGAVITDRASFEKYTWPSAEDYDYSYVDRLAGTMPKGMGLLVWSSDGPLESVIKLTGYENLCYMLYDDEQLAADIFEQVGRRICLDYKKALEKKGTAGIVVGDDWGFNTQTLLPVDIYRKYLFPWHKKIVAMAHESGRMAILHSCGRYDSVIGDIIEDIGYDARHSYEDNITPVEEAYEQLHRKIAVLGGIDVNFLATATKGEIEERARAMLTRTSVRGGYALGSGNSIPDYVPIENYLAMIKTVWNWAI